MTPSSDSPLLRRLWPVLACGLGVASVAFPVLGLPAAFLALLGAIALRRPSDAELPQVRAWLLIGGVASGIGLLRFVVRDAMPGIVGGGGRAVEQQAVSRLREVLFAQDAMRRGAWIDPDGDGIGSAASLPELCGAPPQRGQPERSAPVLHCGELVPSAIGPAARSGAYLYTVCLPLRGGGWSAQPGAPVDEEAAERRFVAYAWPEATSPFDGVFFIDQHESIRVLEGAGRGSPPACDAALHDPGWPAWRGKEPRAGSLPGDRPGAAP